MERDTNQLKFAMHDGLFVLASCGQDCMFRISKCHNKTKRTMAWGKTHMPIKWLPKVAAAGHNNTHFILYRHHVLPQMGCWQSWWCQPQDHRLTSRAQTRRFWGSGRKSWCHSPRKSRFPVACIPWCGKDIGQSVQMSFVLISHCTDKVFPDGQDVRWPSLKGDFNKHELNDRQFPLPITTC